MWKLLPAVPDLQPASERRREVMWNPFRRNRPLKIDVHTLFEFQGKTMRVVQMSYDFRTLDLQLVDEKTYRQENMR